MKTTSKTWGRETALALMAVLIWTVYEDNTKMVEVIVYPFTAYATIAFGLKRAESIGVWSGGESSAGRRGS